MDTFWEERFREEGRIWGDIPSRTAGYAIDLFLRAGVRSVLVPGSGYGRNAEAFARAGFEVTGIELSATAVNLARKRCPAIRYHHGSVLEMPFDDTIYDGIYCFNVLHLFRKADRAVFLERCRDQLRAGGVVFFAVFSDQEPSYGRGRQVEENTFESRPGREVHYYTEADLAAEFPGMEILEIGIMEDPEEHGDEGKHTHILRYIFARNVPG